MILLTLALLGVALTVFNYLKNKQADRKYNRRARLEERQEELIESLRAGKTAKENKTDNES